MHRLGCVCMSVFSLRARANYDLLTLSRFIPRFIILDLLHAEHVFYYYQLI